MRGGGSDGGVDFVTGVMLVNTLQTQWAGNFFKKVEKEIFPACERSLDSGDSQKYRNLANEMPTLITRLDRLPAGMWSDKDYIIPQLLLYRGDAYQHLGQTEDARRSYQLALDTTRIGWNRCGLGTLLAVEIIFLLGTFAVLGLAPKQFFFAFPLGVGLLFLPLTIIVGKRVKKINAVRQALQQRLNPEQQTPLLAASAVAAPPPPASAPTSAFSPSQAARTPAVAVVVVAGPPAKMTAEQAVARFGGYMPLGAGQ